MQLNELVFGNPNQYHLIYLEKQNYLDSLINELSNHPFLANDSEQSTQEIAELIKFTGHLKNDEQLLRRFTLYDSDFEKYMMKRLIDAGLPEKEIKETVNSLHEDILPLLVKLKYIYNRPRPYQLAFYKKMPLHIWRLKNADSPAYPSGHCFQSRIYAEVLGNMYPQYYKALHELANDISWSRQYLGAHFPSDSEFAVYAADIVMKHPEFVKKYKL